MTGFVPDSHAARLPAIAVLTDAQAEQGFTDEGLPAACFVNITVGSAKLFKLLPDGRRQNTGFVGAGQFIGLAVSDIYAFSAEALLDIGLQNEVAICDPMTLKGAPAAVKQSDTRQRATQCRGPACTSPCVSEGVTWRGNPPPARAERRRRAT